MGARPTSPPGRAEPSTRRRVGLFDAIGVLALAAFGATVALDYAELSRPTAEVSLHVEPEALAAGFREGVSWHGLYRDGTKVGYSKTERRRRPGGGFSSTHTMVLPIPGLPGRQTIEVRSELDARFVLERFTAGVEGGPLPISAEGRWTDDGLVVELHGLPGGDQSTTLPMDEPPQLDQSFLPVVTREDLAPGDRFSFTHFDPLTASPTTSVVQYVGTEPLDVLGESVDALHLSQEIAGQRLDVWVNELGEVLRQTLPGGLLSVRESEAEATWGVLGSDGSQEVGAP